MASVSIEFVMGPTNVGKSHYIRHRQDDFENVKVVSVGRYFRSIMNASEFKGNGDLPSLNAGEVMKRFILESVSGHDKGELVVLVDGQPRTVGQVHDIRELCEKLRSMFSFVSVNFVVLKASDETRRQRMMSRDKKKEDLDLSEARFIKDKQITKEVCRCIEKIGWRYEEVSTE